MHAFQNDREIYSGTTSAKIEVGEKEDQVTVPLQLSLQIDAKGDMIYGGVPEGYIAGKYFGSGWTGNAPLSILKGNGVDWVRAGVTTLSYPNLQIFATSWNTLQWQNEYWSALEWTEQIFKEAKEQGMRLNLFFFLSDGAAFSWNQNTPADWKSLSLEELADVLEDYTYQTTIYYKSKGYDIEIYDIGNEIGAGILNYLPGDKINLPAGTDILNDMNYMVNEVWRKEAVLLRAAIAGVKRADPSGHIVLHIAELGISNDDIFPKTFFETMYLEGVELDYAGFSYPYVFKSAPVVQNYFTSQNFAWTMNFIGALGKKVVFSEYSFPHGTGGDFQPAPAGYTYSPAGQKQWMNDFLSALVANPHIIGSFYFYPEHFPGSNFSPMPDLEHSGLFQDAQYPQPALEVFKLF